MQGPSAHQEKGGGDERRVGESGSGAAPAVPEEARLEFAECDADMIDTMEYTVRMLTRMGVTDVVMHKEANMVRKACLSCGGDKVAVRAKFIEVYSSPRVTAMARRLLELNLEEACHLISGQTRRGGRGTLPRLMTGPRPGA